MTNVKQDFGAEKTKNDKKEFQSFSLKLNAFLLSKGLEPIREGIHNTGLILSINGGETWEDFPNLFLAKDAHPDELVYFSVKDMRDAIKESQSHWQISLSKRVKVKKRIRNYMVFKQSPELQSALDEWRATGPKSKNLT